MTSCVLLFFEILNNNSLVSKIPFYFGHIDLFFISVTNYDEVVVSSQSRFLIFSKEMFHFELHPKIPEIHTKILMYGKGVLIKHSKAPATVTVEIPDL